MKQMFQKYARKAGAVLLCGLMMLSFASFSQFSQVKAESVDPLHAVESGLQTGESKVSPQEGNITAASGLMLPDNKNNQWIPSESNVLKSSGRMVQGMDTTPGEKVYYRFEHRGAAGSDVMNFYLGPEGEPGTLVRTCETDDSGWQVYEGSYTVPPGQTRTDMSFEWVLTASENPENENLVQNLQLFRPSSLTIEKSVETVGTEEDMVAAGDVLTISILLANTGEHPSSRTLVTDTIPQGMVYIDGSASADGQPVPAQNTEQILVIAAGNNANEQGGSLPAAETLTVQYQVLVTGDGLETGQTLQSQAQVRYNDLDLEYLNKAGEAFDDQESVSNSVSLVFSDSLKRVPQGAPPRPANELTYDVRYIVTDADGQQTVVETHAVRPGELVPRSAYNHAAAGNKVFVHWYQRGASETVEFNYNTPVHENIDLIAYYDDAYYVVFASGGTPVEIQLVRENEKANLPPAPEREGYEFRYWSLEKDGDEFDFDTPIQKTITLHGVWKGKEVNYRVFYWLEKQDMPEDFDADNIANYEFIYEEDRKATAGTERAITSAESTIVPDYDNKAYPHGSFMGSEYYASTKETIQGDGSTIVDVFYTRLSYTYEFNIQPWWLNDNETVKTYQGRPYPVGHMTVDGTIYTSDEESSSSGENDKKYSFTAKYGQDVSELWPSFTWNVSSDQSSYTFIGWINNWNSLRAPKDHIFLGVSRISEEVVPRKGNSVMVYSLWTRSPEFFDYMSYVEIGVWEDINDYDYIFFNDKYYKRNSQSDYTLSGWKSGANPGRPVSSVPAGYSDEGFPIGEWKYPYFVDARNHKKVLAYREEQNIVIIKKDGIDHVQLYTFGSRNSYTLKLVGLQETSVDHLLQFEEPLSRKMPDQSQLVKEGYTFEGWYTDKEFTNPYQAGQGAIMPAHDLVLYAKWKPNNEVSVTYYDTDESVLGIEYYEKGDTVQKPSSFDYAQPGQLEPERGVFHGWYWYLNSIDQPLPFPFGSVINSDLSLYALWGEKLSVTYDANGGEGTVPEDKMRYLAGTVARVQDADLKKDGRELVGWQIKDSSDVTVYEPGYGLLMYENITLVAVYESLAELEIEKSARVMDESGKVLSESIGTPEEPVVVEKEHIIEYTLKVIHEEGGTAEELVVEDILPWGLIPESADGMTITEKPDGQYKVSWSIEKLVAGSEPLEFTVKVKLSDDVYPQGAVFENAAKLTEKYAGTIDSNHTYHELLPRASFTLTKKLEGVSESQEQFVFRVERLDPDTKAVLESFYGVVAVEAGSKEASIIFDDLLPGTYRITEEDTNWRYQNKGSASQEIELEPENLNGALTFVNKRISDQWLDGNSNVINHMKGL